VLVLVLVLLFIVVSLLVALVLVLVLAVVVYVHVDTHVAYMSVHTWHTDEDAQIDNPRASKSSHAASASYAKFGVARECLRWHVEALTPSLHLAHPLPIPSPSCSPPRPSPPVPLPLSSPRCLLPLSVYLCLPARPFVCDCILASARTPRRVALLR